MLGRWGNKQTGIVFIVMVIGAILMSIVPVWFAPPNVASTVWFYEFLLVLWIPVLIILVILYHRGALGSVILLVALGLIIMIIALAIGGPNFSAWAYKAENCTSREVWVGETEYTCRLPSSGQETLILQGPTGSPFARLIKHTFFGAS